MFRFVIRIVCLASLFSLGGLPIHAELTNVRVIKFADAAGAAPGTNVTYTIALQNEGSVDATNVHLLDPVPFHTTFVSFNGPGNWSCVTPAVGSTGNVVCSTAVLAPGADQFTLVVKVDPDVSIGTPFINTASLSAIDNDSDGSDNSASATVTTAVSNLKITKDDFPDPVAAGSQLTYVVSAYQQGGLHAKNATWSDTLPPGTTFAGLEKVQGTESFDCITPDIGNTGTVTCSKADFGEIGHHISMYRIYVNVDPDVSPGTVLTNAVTFTSDTDDADPEDNEASVNTTVSAASANLSITKETGSVRKQLGQDVTFTLTVTNHGPSNATGVVVDDTLPSGLQFVSATPSQGSCNAASPIHCTLGTLANGASATVMVTATITSLPVTNTATVSGNEADSVSGNNSASASVLPVIPALSPLALALLSVFLAGTALIILRK